GLVGRNAVITGGGRGIGLACADALAEAGARVIIVDHDVAIADEGLAFLRAKGHRAEAAIVDVTDSRGASTTSRRRRSRRSAASTSLYAAPALLEAAHRPNRSATSIGSTCST